jgi:CDP-diacylglycerol---serine O-phosphatidyltransferase
MKKRRGDIYLLPSILSITNVLFGFLSLLSSFHAKYAWAAFWIMAAAVMDGLDGLIARAVKAQSDFGVQLDSLADCFSFGAAPAILLYFWGLQVETTGAALFSFLFLVGGIFRLARFNVLQKSQSDKRYYLGLTVPSASIFLSSLVLLHPRPLTRPADAAVLSVIIVFVSFCMVSRIRYRNWLNFNFLKKINLKTGLALAVVIGGFILYTRLFLLIFLSLNVLSGPLAGIAASLRKTRRSPLPTQSAP